MPSKVKTAVLRITGRADPSVASIEAGLNYSSLTKIQLSGGRFSAVLELTPGRNQFVFQPYAVGGSALQSDIQVITYEKQVVEAHAPDTSLDLHGAELGFERLPTERGVSYKQRLLQGSKGKDDPRTFIQNAYATEMGFPFSREMVRVKVDRTGYNRPKLTNGFVKITPTQFKYTGDQLLASEGPVRFDAGYPYITPDQEVSPFGAVRVIQENGEPVATGDYEYEAETGRVWLKNPDLSDQDLLLVYNYVTSFTLAGNDLAALKALVDATGYLEMIINDTDYHTSTTDSDWLVPKDWTAVPEDEDYPTDSLRTDPGVYLSVCEVNAWALHEHADDLLDNGSGLGTKLEKYVREVNRVDHRTWDKIVVGRDGLRDENVTPLYDAFPHLTDAKRGHWGSNEYNIHEVHYLGTGVDDQDNQFVGIRPLQWQSGVGQLGDLEPDFAVQEVNDTADITDTEEDQVNILYGIL